MRLDRESCDTLTKVCITHSTTNPGGKYCPTLYSHISRDLLLKTVCCGLDSRKVCTRALTSSVQSPLRWPVLLFVGWQWNTLCNIVNGLSDSCMLDISIGTIDIYQSACQVLLLALSRVYEYMLCMLGIIIMRGNNFEM